MFFELYLHSDSDKRLHEKLKLTLSIKLVQMSSEKKFFSGAY